MKRGLLLALLLSMLLHLIALAAPGWHLGNLLAGNAPPLEAELRAPPEKKQVAPAVPAVPRKAARKPVPAPLPEAEAAPPETLAAAEAPALSETQSAPVPAPEPEVATAPEAASAPIPEAVAAAPEIAPPLPRSGRIRYAITRGASGFTIGQSIHEWQHDGKHYVINAVSETTGVAAIFKPVKVTQSSEGGFLQGELKPDSFRFDRGDNDIATASFDWKTQQVTLGDGQVIPIADGAEDFLSMFYQLMQAAQRGEGFVMAVATGKKVERYAFEWLGEEELILRPGHYHVWHVRVRAASGGKDTTEVWLAREAAGLPVKIRFTDRKGDVSEQVAEQIDYEGK